MVQDLPSQFEVRNGAAGLEVVQHDRSSVAGRLRKTDIARNDRVKHLPWEISVDLLTDLEREACPAVEHREQDSQKVESGIELVSDELHGLLEKMGQPLERVELTLQRDEHSVSRDEHVDGQKTKRRRAIDDDVVIGRRDGLEHVSESVLAARDADELDIGRQQSQPRHDCLLDSLLGGLATEEYVVDRRMETGLLDAQPGRRVALRI